MMRAPNLSHLEGAKRRAASRTSSDGAVMFVVAMTITVLAALGAWALQSAALEVRMAGYERQNTQTHYISEYGVLTAMQTLTAEQGGALIGFAISTPQTCLSAPIQNIANPNPLAKACYVWNSAQQAVSNLPNSVYQNPAGTGPSAIDPSSVTGATPGSFGLTSMQGDFVVELTEPAQGPPLQGTSTSGNSSNTSTLGSYWVTLTSYGRTNQSTNPNSIGFYNSEGDEVLRTRVLAGPLTVQH